MTTARERLDRIDFDRLFREYAELPVWNGAFSAVGLPTVTIRWSERPGTSSGRCSMQKVSPTGAPAVGGRPTSRSRISVTIYRHGQVADVIQTVLHEMTHAAGWMDHSHRFYNTLREAVAVATGVDCNAEWTKVYEYDRKQREDLHAVYGENPTGLPLRKAGAAKVAAKRKGKTVLPRLDVAALTADFDID